MTSTIMSLDLPLRHGPGHDGGGGGGERHLEQERREHRAHVLARRVHKVSAFSHSYYYNHFCYREIRTNTDPPNDTKLFEYFDFP